MGIDPAGPDSAFMGGEHTASTHLRSSPLFLSSYEASKGADRDVRELDSAAHVRSQGGLAVAGAGTPWAKSVAPSYKGTGSTSKQGSGFPAGKDIHAQRATAHDAAGCAKGGMPKQPNVQRPEVSGWALSHPNRGSDFSPAPTQRLHLALQPVQLAPPQKQKRRQERQLPGRGGCGGSIAPAARTVRFRLAQQPAQLRSVPEESEAERRGRLATACTPCSSSSSSSSFRSSSSPIQDRSVPVPAFSNSSLINPTSAQTGHLSCDASSSDCSGGSNHSGSVHTSSGSFSRSSGGSTGAGRDSAGGNSVGLDTSDSLDSALMASSGQHLERPHSAPLPSHDPALGSPNRWRPDRSSSAPELLSPNNASSSEAASPGPTGRLSRSASLSKLLASAASRFRLRTRTHPGTRTVQTAGAAGGAPTPPGLTSAFGRGVGACFGRGAVQADIDASPPSQPPFRPCSQHQDRTTPVAPTPCPRLPDATPGSSPVKTAWPEAPPTVPERRPATPPPELVAQLRQGGLSRTDLLMASRALALGAQLRRVSVEQRAAAGQQGARGSDQQAGQRVVSALFQRAMAAACEVSYGPVRDLAQEAVWRYADPGRGCVEEVVRRLLREACGARG